MALDTSALFSYLSLFSQALIPLVVGSFKSLKTPAVARKAKRPTGRIPADNESDSDSDDQDLLDESVTWTESLLFPVFGSAALLGLWLIIRYVGKEWLNIIIGVYFGIFAIQDTLGSVARTASRVAGYKSPIYHFRISSGFRQIYHAKATLPSLLLVPVAVAVPLLYIPLGKPYLLSNVIALCLATSTIGMLRLDSFFTAFILLSCLLVYDVFWVFATPVMVDVATSIDAPIKLLSPRPSSSSPSSYALLGLGDIVIPGLLISLCLRFDLYRHALSYPKEDTTPKSKFGWGYFYVGMASYVLGLGTCMGVMLVFGKAQPALLYLSPACILGPIGFAAIRGEVPLLWAYTDSPSTDTPQTTSDDTIEAPSEAAQRARSDAKAKAQLEEAEGEVATPPVNEDEGEGEDDSWMEMERPSDGAGVGGGGGDGSKARRRKGKKK